MAGTAWHADLWDEVSNFQTLGFDATRVEVDSESGYTCTISEVMHVLQVCECSSLSKFPDIHML